LVPTSFIGVATFLVLVVPGTYYELVRSKTLFPAEESAFLQISRILLSGALVSTAMLVLLAIVGLVSPDALVDIPAMLRGGTGYVADHWAVTLKTVVIQLLGALLLVLVACEFLARNATGVFRQGTALYGVTELMKKKTDHAHLNVRLKSGREVIGKYYGETTDYDPSKRELVLEQPMMKVSEAGEKPVPIEPGYHRLVIAGDQIEYIYVCYVDTYVGKPSKREIVKKIRRCQENYSERLQKRGFRVLVEVAALVVLVVLSGIPIA
jgi:hypothetical protein